VLKRGLRPKLVQAFQLSGRAIEKTVTRRSDLGDDHIPDQLKHIATQLSGIVALPEDLGNHFENQAGIARQDGFEESHSLVLSDRSQ
jgi:hypothetical protein